MSSTTKSQIKSSERLQTFLEEHNLHKKDFAEMIGVTLSYVYSLIGEEVPFSTRTTTIERIAVVMNCEPESFIEYRNSEEPRIIDPGVQFLKDFQTKMGLSNVQLLKRFPRSLRVDIVDMWRGALPLPIDWVQLTAIGDVLGAKKEDLYPYWEMRIQQHLISGGIDPLTNANLVKSMFKGVRELLKITI